MCILHCIMVIGRLVVQILEELCKPLNNITRVGLQAELNAVRTGVRLGSTASPDGEEVYCLLQVWEQLLNAACMEPTHPANEAIVDLWELLEG